VLDAVAALVPPVFVGLLFWFVVRAMIGADRKERAALAAMDRAEREQQAAEQQRAGRKPGQVADENASS
jgi:hypothetical protein